MEVYSNDLNRTGHEDSKFLLDNSLPDDHFSRVPSLSPFVSQLDVGEYGMRFPASPRCDRLEMRCAQGHIMESGPINPFHIAALHSERRRSSKSARSHLSTAPIQQAPRQSDSPLFGDMSWSLGRAWANITTLRLLCLLPINQRRRI